MFSKTNLKTAAIAFGVIWLAFKTKSGANLLASTPSVDV